MEDAKPFATMLTQELLRMVAISSQIILSDKKYCSTLRDHVQKANTEVLKSVANLIEAQKNCIAKKSKAKVAPFTGKAWDKCKEYAKLDLNNFSAIKYELTCWSLPLIKDATKELEEVKESFGKEEADDLGFEDEDDIFGVRFMSWLFNIIRT